MNLFKEVKLLIAEPSSYTYNTTFTNKRGIRFKQTIVKILL